jgi:hypothetical protein
MDLQEVIWGIMDWIDLAEDRGRCRSLVKEVMNIKCVEFFDKPVSFSRMTLMHGVSELPGVCDIRCRNFCTFRRTPV